MSKILSPISRSGASTIVGLLACQTDSYRKSLQTTVVSCSKALDNKGYEVEFEDTVLFPEGGGQPNDVGTIRLVGSAADEEPISCYDVQRDGLTAVHLVSKPLDKGTKVELQVDWKRRWDLMQQHTGQHLLSAVLDKRNCETLSWSMGSKFNYVELPRKLSQEEVNEVQHEVNDAIRKAVDVYVELPDHKKVDIDHHVPEDYDLSNGVIRVVHIGDLDSNPCCGTHLKNTAHIGALVLLHSQNIRGTNSRLFFMAGERVTEFAAEANAIIRNVNSSLSCQTDDIAEKLARLHAQLKEGAARERTLLLQLVKYEAAGVKKDLSESKFSLLYKPEASNDYSKMLEKELGKLNNGAGTLLYITGEAKKPGSIVISGDDTDKYATKVKEIIPDVKGGGKGKWQGKVVAWQKKDLDQILQLSPEAVGLENLKL